MSRVSWLGAVGAPRHTNCGGRLPPLIVFTKESMSMSKGTYSITTPIYYVNAAPHLGTAYTTIAADAVARYQRLNGYDVSFVTGMDEHGQKVADTAASKGMTPQTWCDSMEPVFREVWDLLDISYTDFVRTTEPRHAKTVKTFWNDLYERGYLYKGSYEG